LLLPLAEDRHDADAHALLHPAAGGHVEEPPADPREAPVDARPRGWLLRAEALGRLELDREGDRGRDGDRLGVRLRRHVAHAGTGHPRRQDEARESEEHASETGRRAVRRRVALQQRVTRLPRGCPTSASGARRRAREERIVSGKVVVLFRTPRTTRDSARAGPPSRLRSAYGRTRLPEAQSPPVRLASLSTGHTPPAALARHWG